MLAGSSLGHRFRLDFENVIGFPTGQDLGLPVPLPQACLSSWPWATITIRPCGGWNRRDS